MRTVRFAVVVALLAIAAIAGALAIDVLSWRNAMRRGDSEFVRNPANATWHATAVLPFDPARGLLQLDTPLRFRDAEQSFAAVHAAGEGYDNGLSETRNRGVLEAELTDLATSSDQRIASAADNLLGILAFADATATGPAAPAPVDQSVSDFQAAVRLDPADIDAKYNLELLLRRLVAHGIRTGPSPSAGGPSRGHRGAGGGIPGTGY